MSYRTELFHEQSKMFEDFLDSSKAWVYGPDENKVRNIFDIPKSRIEEIDQGVRSGKLDLGEAEELRQRIAVPAWQGVYNYVLNNWNIRDSLATIFAKYERDVYGEKIQQPDVEEGIRRIEALRKLEEVSFELATWH
jgi:hypothetical protein